jgi:hypothetical protein
MGRKKHTIEDINEWLSGTGITLVGEYTNALQKTTFRCANGHEWEAKPNKIKYGRGCSVCKGGIKHTHTEFSDWLNKNCQDITTKDIYKSSHVKMKFECTNGHEWEARPYSIKNGSRCPKCADHTGGGFKPNEPAWTYIFIRDNYLKFGVTNDLDRRLRVHKQNGNLLLIFNEYYDNGQFAIDWERNIKQKYGGNFATKEQCPDGYTETLPISLLEELISNSST